MSDYPPFSSYPFVHDINRGEIDPWRMDPATQQENPTDPFQDPRQGVIADQYFAEATTSPGAGVLLSHMQAAGSNQSLRNNLQVELSQLEMSHLNQLDLVKRDLDLEISKLSPEQREAFNRGQVPVEIIEMLRRNHFNLVQNSQGKADPLIAADLAVVVNNIPITEIRERYMTEAVKLKNAERRQKDINAYWASFLASLRESIELSKST